MKQVFETGISKFISTNFSQIPWEGLNIPAQLPKKKYVRWAAFLRLVSPEKAVQILKDLKLDNDTISKVKTLVTWSGVELPDEAAAVRRAMSQMEPEVWDALMELNGYGVEIRSLSNQIRERGDCLSLKTLAVKGADLIAAGVKPGKEMGGMLNRMLDLVLETPELNEKETLLAWLKNTSA